MVMMPSPLPFSKSVQLCRMFDAKMGVCQDSDTQSLMNNVLLSNPQKDECVAGEYRYWCGLTDVKENEVWLNVNNDEELEDGERPWLLGEPNGRDQENCVETKLTVSENKNVSGWNDDSCVNRNKCFFCHFQKRPEYTLRGLSLCHMETFDHKYKWTDQMVNDKYVFTGYMGSRIYWNKSNKTWKVTGKLGKQLVERQLTMLREVYKLNENNGREFFVCAKPKGSKSQCDFFQWND